MRRATRRAGSGSSWGREKSEPHRRPRRARPGRRPRAPPPSRVGRAPAQRRDVAAATTQRVGGADRGAQVVDVGQHPAGQRQRARPQAVDALRRALEGQRARARRRRVAGDGEGQLAAETRPARTAAGARHLDQRAHERGDQQPGALVDGIGIGAQAPGGRGATRAQRLAGAAHGDEDGLLVARALGAQLAGAALELGVEQRSQPRDAVPSAIAVARSSMTRIRTLLGRPFRQVAPVACGRPIMEAATPSPLLPGPHARRVACGSTASWSTTQSAVRLAREREAARRGRGAAGRRRDRDRRPRARPRADRGQRRFRQGRVREGRRASSTRRSSSVRGSWPSASTSASTTSSGPRTAT